MKQSNPSSPQRRESAQSSGGFHKSRLFKLFSGMLVLGASLATVPLLTDEKFDPDKYISKKCKGKLACFGLENEPKSQRDTVPKDAASFIRHRGLPSRVDLSPNFPPVGSQGRQGSCVAWTTAYAIKSYQERVERKWSFDAGGGVNTRCNGGASKVFSPAFIYNQINKGRDRGSSIYNAFRLMVRDGAAPCQYMPYNVRDYLTQPNSRARSAARRYRASRFNRINCATNLNAVKSVLAKGNPLAAGFRVTKSMYRVNRVKNAVWDTYDPPVRGGHAMAIVGYDDSRTSQRGHRGAFKIMNSWGTRFGDRGFMWISYRNMRRVCKYSYVMYDRQGSGGGGGGGSPVRPGPSPTNNVTKKAVPPRRVSATRGNFSKHVDVSWDRVSAARAYGIYRAGPGSNSFRRLAWRHGSKSNYRDDSVQPNISYRYRILVIASGSRSNLNDSPTAEGYAKSSDRPRNPSRVSGLSGFTSRGKVNLIWNSQSSADYYQVARYNPRTRKWGLIIRRTTGRAATDSRPIRNSKNYYAVRAVNAAGAGKWSSPARVAVGGKSVTPARVRSLTASRGTHRNKVSLRWGEISGAVLYQLYRYSYSTRKWSYLTRTSRLYYDDDSRTVSNGRKYAYAIAPVSEAGRGRFSRPVVGWASPFSRRGSILEAPKGVTSSMRNGTISIKWKAVTGAQEYYVFRKKGENGKLKFISGTNKTSYSEKIPSKGDVYLYTIRTKSLMGGESANSEFTAGFVNEEVFSVRHRLLPGVGMEKFVGTWRADHVTNTEAYSLVLKVRNAGGGKYEVTITRNGKRARKVGGKYVARSSYLENDGFKMRVLDDDKKAAAVEITNRRLYPDEIEIVFTKD